MPALELDLELDLELELLFSAILGGLVDGRVSGRVKGAEGRAGTLLRVKIGMLGGEGGDEVAAEGRELVELTEE